MNKKLERIFDKVKDNDEEWNKLNDGEKKLVRFWNFSRQDEKSLTGEIIIDDILWDYELEDFVKALNKYEVNSLVFASTWSSAIVVLMYLLDNGWETKGTIVYKIEKGLFGNKDKEVKGIKLIRK
jgi:hypothetical protein